MRNLEVYKYNEEITILHIKEVVSLENLVLKIINKAKDEVFREL